MLTKPFEHMFTELSEILDKGGRQAVTVQRGGMRPDTEPLQILNRASSQVCLYSDSVTCAAHLDPESTLRKAIIHIDAVILLVHGSLYISIP